MATLLVQITLKHVEQIDIVKLSKVIFHFNLKRFILLWQDCRAGLNFCDEHEAGAFKEAIKERIKDFRRKRQG